MYHLVSVRNKHSPALCDSISQIEKYEQGQEDVILLEICLTYFKFIYESLKLGSATPLVGMK